MSGEMLHEILWQQNVRLGEVCLHHPFVRGLADGTLDPKPSALRSPGRVLPQRVRSAYALAAARSQDGETLISLCELLNGSCGNFSYTPVTRKSSRLNWLACTVSGGSSLYGLLACDRLAARAGRDDRGHDPLRATLRLSGHRTGEDHGAGNPYQQWIATYSGADFQALVTRVESVTDSIAEDTLAVRDAYEYAMGCELNFFSAMLEPQHDADCLDHRRVGSVGWCRHSSRPEDLSPADVYGMSVLTLLTVQNTRSVDAVEPLAPGFVLAQLDSVLEDIPPHAAKTGALGTREIIEAIARRAAHFSFPL